MSFRRQFVVAPTPEGYVDEEFEYYFDSNNTIALSVTLLPGESILNIILPFQRDTDFILRGIQVSGNTGSLAVRFWDGHGNQLSDGEQEVDRSYGATLNAGQPVGRLPVIVEPEIRIPRGGFMMVDVLNLP